MKHAYNLVVEDHLVWYDQQEQNRAPGVLERLLPALHRYNNRRDREIYAEFIRSPANATALGLRSIQLTREGVREVGSGFDFCTRWSDVENVVVTLAHLFIAHHSLNAHVVPLATFLEEKMKKAFIEYAVSRGANLPNQALEPTIPAVTPCAPSSTSSASRDRGSS